MVVKNHLFGGLFGPGPNNPCPAVRGGSLPHTPTTLADLWARAKEGLKTHFLVYFMPKWVVFETQPGLFGPGPKTGPEMTTFGTRNHHFWDPNHPIVWAPAKEPERSEKW